MNSISCRLCGLLLVAISVHPAIMLGDEPTSELQFAINDSAGKPQPCRIHLRDAAGTAQKAPGLPFFKDHFVCPGRVALKLPLGECRYELARGPEHQRLSGMVELRAGRDHVVTEVLGRVADLSKTGWYGGDLHVHRPVEDIELLMRAEDLHVAPVITWWNQRNLWTGRDIPRELLRQFDGNRFYHVMGGEDERGGGAVLFFQFDRPLAIADAKREVPSSAKYVAEIRERDPRVWIDIEKPFWWDVPLWVAGGKCNSIGIANNHMCRSQMYPNEAWGRPRDLKQLPDPHGNGYWTQEIYYHLLNCGVRLPPSAGSASGVLPNPVGYNRVYVNVEGDLTYAKWWDGLKAGRSFVTNGPLLVCRVNGHLPGHVFTADAGPLELTFDVSVISNDPVQRTEIIHNGRVIRTIDFDGLITGQVDATRKVSVKVSESGWFLVRAITNVPHTFRFASTAPFYIELGDRKRHVSRRSAKFFADWVDERIDRLREVVKDEAELRDVLGFHESARNFWQDRLVQANAE